MSAPGTRTHGLEHAVMDLHDDGKSCQQIADALGEPFNNVRRVIGYMRENSNERTTALQARMGSARLAAAILATGRQYA